MDRLGVVLFLSVVVVAAGAVSAQEVAERDTVIIQEQKPVPDTLDDENGAYGEDDPIGEMEPGDVNELRRRRRSLRLYTAGFGPAGFGNIDINRLAYNVFTGVFWEVNPYAMVKTFFDATADFDEAFMLSVNLGANFIPINDEISPFIGGSLGLGYADRKGDNAFGFDLGGAVGVMLFRKSTTQMLVEGVARVLLNEIREEFPYVYAVRVGILF